VDIIINGNPDSEEYQNAQEWLTENGAAGRGFVDE
jgi:hypothetical protein